MLLKPLAHACMLISDEQGQPLLATDPWLTGSCYWRSWWLENPPSSTQIEEVMAADYLYISHEHPDHLHTVTLRRIGRRPEILLPAFLKGEMGAYLAAKGWRTRVLPAGRWVTLKKGLRVLSLPVWNNDSVLVVETPTSIIKNLNDAKPRPRQFAQLGAISRATARKVIALRSHSPASPVNCYFRNRVRIDHLSKRAYVQAVCRACDMLAADWYIPFASQVTFARPYSVWANAYRVMEDDLQRYWNSATTLLPAFSNCDLRSPCPSPGRPRGSRRRG